MERAAAEWRYDAIHEDEPYHDGTFKNFSAVRTIDTPYHYRDGVNVWVAKHDLTPDDDFLGAVGSEHVAHGEADE